MSNILVVGDFNSVINHLDFNENHYWLLTSEFKLGLLSSDKLALVYRYATIKTSSEYSSSCYEKNIDKIIEVVRNLIVRNDDIDYVISTLEHSVVPAATIRSEFAVSGTKENTAVLLRDKVLSKLALMSANSIPVPKFLSHESMSKDNVISFIEEHGRCVVKPRSDAGSRGVGIVENIDDYYLAISGLDFNNIEIEQYISGDVYHFNGIVQDGVIKFFAPYRYYNTPLDYTKGVSVMGNISLVNASSIQKTKLFTHSVLDGLNYRNGVFHLEAICHNEEFYFLEIAGRSPGARIVDVIKSQYGVDLVHQAVLVESGFLINQDDF